METALYLSSEPVWAPLMGVLIESGFFRRGLKDCDPGGWVDEALGRELTLVMRAHLQVQGVLPWRELGRLSVAPRP